VANCHLPTPVGSCCFIRRSSEKPKLISILAASSPTCCGIIADFHLRSQALATSLSSYDIVVHCGIIADLWLTATFPLLWDLAVSFNEAVRDQTLSLFLGHHRRLVAASLPTFICAHRRLRLHCRLNLYSGISTSVVQLLQQLGPNNYLLRTSVRLILLHHCRLESAPRRTTCSIDGRLESSSDRTTCGVTAVLIIIVATLPLPHFCGIMLLLVAI
jgi:hypothetical protein